MSQPTADATPPALSLKVRQRAAHNAITTALHEQGADEYGVALALEYLAELGLNHLPAVVAEALEVRASVEAVKDDPYNVGHYVDGIPHGKIHLNAEAFLDAQREVYRGLLARLVMR